MKAFHFVNVLFHFIYLQDLHDDPPTNKNLALLIIQLLQFQEEHIKKNITRTAVTKLPVSLNY